MAWQRIALEVSCLYEYEQGVHGPAPSYCKWGPGSPDTHCLTGEEGIRPELKPNQDTESHPCPYAGYKRGRGVVVVTDAIGDQHFSDEFWQDNLASDLWDQEQKRWIERITGAIRETEEI